MDNGNLRPSDRAAVVGVINPDAHTAATYTTGWISMQKFRSLLAIVMLGQLGAAGTLAAKLEQASDADGTGAKDISAKAITTLTAAGSPTVDNDNKQALINVKAEDLDLANGFTHARLSMTVAVATSDAAGLLLGLDPAYGPASDDDRASVVEIV